MKNIIKNTIVILMLAWAMPLHLSTAKETTITENKTVAADAKIMTDRLLAIKAMDKSMLTRVEKKALRKEVKTINTSLADLNGGVYLTTGAIIIIILLLILIL